MTAPLQNIGLKSVGILPLDLGSGWFHVVLQTSDGDAKPLWYLGNNQANAQRQRVLIEIWAHENCTGKWVLENGGVVFSKEEDAMLFSVALG